MADEGHEATEALIGEVSERVRREYVAAYEGAEEKLADYLRRFEAKDRIHAEAVRRGKETEAEYREWRRGQILVGKRWQEMVDTLAEDYRNADRIAASITSGYLPDAYAINHDYATFQVEKGSNLDTSYTLYDRATVEHLIRDQPDLLPAVKVDGRKDKAWNRRHLASAITQGVLQGESMDQVARRVRSVADMDYRAAMRTARTAMTSAQNAGRVDAYRRAGGMGIRVRKQWLATLDQRTRHSHRRLDGEVVGMDEGFSNGLSYPGDPGPGIGSEVYNCRCTLVPVVDGVDPSEGVRHSNLGGVSYEEWRGERERRAATGGSPALLPNVAQALGQDYVDAMDTLLHFTEEQDAAELFRRRGGLVRVADAHERGGAYFSPADGGVHMNAARVAEGDPGEHPLHAPYQTAFHEFAHNIDYSLAEGRGNYVSGSWRSADGLTLKGVLERDWINYKSGWVRRALDEADEDAFEALVDFSPRLMVRKVMSADSGRHGAGRWADVADRLLGVRRDEIIRDPEFQEYVRDVYLADPPSYAVRSEGVIFYMKRDLAGDVGRGATVSDALEGVAHVDYPLGSGHGRDYHDSNPENTAAEFFAEVVDSKVCNPAALEYAREVFPNGVAAVEEMIGGMLGD